MKSACNSRVFSCTNLSWSSGQGHMMFKWNLCEIHINFIQNTHEIHMNIWKYDFMCTSFEMSLQVHRGISIMGSSQLSLFKCTMNCFIDFKNRVEHPYDCKDLGQLRKHFQIQNEISGLNFNLKALNYSFRYPWFNSTVWLFQCFDFVHLLSCWASHFVK